MSGVTLARSLVFGGLAAWSNLAMSEEPRILQMNTESVMTLDPATVKLRGGSLGAWIDIWHLKPLPNGARSSKVLISVDCERELWRVVGGTSYSETGASGTPVETAGPDSKYQLVVPGTTGEKMVGSICYMHENGTLQGFSAEWDAMDDMKTWRRPNQEQTDAAAQAAVDVAAAAAEAAADAAQKASTVPAEDDE